MQGIFKMPLPLISTNAKRPEAATLWPNAPYAAPA
jgi:hypothetical protein